MIKNWSLGAARAILLAAAITSVAPQMATAAVHAEHSLTATGQTDGVQPPTEDPEPHNPWG
ncbi:hypothetical protein ABZS61_23210 [Streptomyces sp. NPDC005566]|uniref:hypothetical protein n=1 Tax=Streptomyces sp. NPDC005566 TaxID=3156886 RepID=UPI0033A67733